MKLYLQQGFTLLELLLVISIIGILAAIVLSATAEARFQSQAVAMAAQMKQVERAMYSYQLSEGFDTWPPMPSSNFTHADNQLNNLIDSSTNFPNLDRHISGEPVNYAGEPYTYFTRGGTYVECVSPGDPITDVGHGLRIEDMDERLFKRLDMIIDGEYDSGCGRLKRLGGSGAIYFDISQVSW